MTTCLRDQLLALQERNRELNTQTALAVAKMQQVQDWLLREMGLTSTHSYGTLGYKNGRFWRIEDGKWGLWEGASRDAKLASFALLPKLLETIEAWAARTVAASERAATVMDRYMLGDPVPNKEG